MFTSPHPSELRGRPRFCLAAVALGWLLAAPAAAQSYGQWWWQASVQLEQHSTENLSDEVRLRRFSQQGLQLSGDLNGFIIDPLFGSFRVHVDLLLSELEGARFEGSDRFGGQVDVRLFPRGKYPLRFHVGRRAFDYTLPADGDPLSLARDADRQQQWGANVRATRGFLRGLEVGLDSLTTNFFDADARPTREDNQTLKWERSAGRVRHRLQIARRDQSLGLVDFDREHLSVFFDQQGALGEHWEWLFNASGIQQQITFNQLQRDVDDYRLFTKLYRPFRDRDRLEIDVDVDLTRSGFSGSAERYDLLARYRWQRRPGFQVAPFVRWAEQSSDSESLSSPRAGLSLVWTADKGSFDSVLTFTSSAGTVDRSGTSGSDESNVDASITASLGHGEIHRLRQQLDLTLSRNELTSRGETGSFGDPDLGLTRSVGGQDFARARLTLDRRVAQRSTSAWVEWTQLEARDALFGGGFTSDTLSATATRSGRRFTLSANAGETQVQREALPDQQIDFVVGLVSLRPWRSLNLQASYRQDAQRALFTPDVDSRSLEVRMSFRFALLELEGRFFEIEQMVAGGPLRTNRGFNWSIRRRLGGLLPIFSAPQRRGVIR